MRQDLSRLESLFNAALERPADERETFLASATAAQPELLSAVRRLLAAHTAAGAFLAEPAALAASASLGDLVGSRIGPYQLTARLGEGGTGVVYAAEQTAPLQRSVAIKVIRPGMASAEVLDRFATERQALAVMQHPGIARVFDAGVTNDGRPFFAMERIDGRPITAHADAAHLPLPARLTLFLRVCDAVQHAHQKGVIHRDLKPSNVLVGPDDSPKVIDFGIAKAVGGPTQHASQLTLGVRFIGTPAYMAPEQTHPGGDIDTRCDVYALGVVLCELLCGALPHPARSLASLDLDELCRRIREEDAVRPSLRFAALPASESSAFAARRGLTPKRLLAALRGDLDWIVLRCLETDRERRYASVSALADDLRRHLAHEPVLAAAPSAAYRVRKFVRRHRAMVLAASVALLSLSAATVLSLVHAHRARQAERAAALAADTRQAVVDFLRKDILQQASPEEQANRGLTVLEALDRAAAKLDGRFPQQPLIEAAIRTTLGSTYSALGRYDIAHQHHLRGHALRLAALGPDDRLTQQALNNVVISLNDLGRHAEAARLAEDSVATLTRVYGVDDPQTIQTEQTLGSTRLLTEEWTAAERVLSSALLRARRVFGPAHADTIVLLSNLTVCQIQGGRYLEAEPLLRELLALRETSLGAEHPRTLYVVQNLSAVCAKLGRTDEAATLGERVLDTRRRTLGPQHPQTSIAEVDLAAIREQQQRWDDAALLYQSALAAQRTSLGNDNRRTASTATHLAALRLRAGAPSDALDLLRPALDTLTRTRGPEHDDTVNATFLLARTWLANGAPHEARDLLAPLSERLRATHPTDAPTRREAETLLAEATAAQAAKK